MKMIYILLLMFNLSFESSWANNHEHTLPLDLDGHEYQSILHKSTLLDQVFDKEPMSLSHVIRLGERNMAWLSHINSFRPLDQQLTFSTPENRKTYPVEAPSIYNESIIEAKYQELVKLLPQEMKRVLVDGQNFTKEVPLSLKAYLDFGLEVDRVYQSAARWNIMKPYLGQLKSRRSLDIRGFYFLERLPNRDEKLRLLITLPTVEQTAIKSWLLGICYNTETSDAVCDRALSQSLDAHGGDGRSFYTKYVSLARQIHDANFKIPSWAVRNDIQWSASNDLLATIPFLDNVTAPVKEWLANIEAEWNWKGWQLRLNYVKSGFVPNVEFRPGVTPHVDRLGGNNIVMDANQPLTEWDGQWTIRHEFGHVLGLPDCYVEFYDSTISAIVNYQIDVENLMCSRKGQLKEIHFEEMKNNYFGKNN